MTGPLLSFTISIIFCPTLCITWFEAPEELMEQILYAKKFLLVGFDDGNSKLSGACSWEKPVTKCLSLLFPNFEAECWTPFLLQPMDLWQQLRWNMTFRMSHDHWGGGGSSHASLWLSKLDWAVLRFAFRLWTQGKKTRSRRHLWGKDVCVKNETIVNCDDILCNVDLKSFEIHILKKIIPFTCDSTIS